MAGGEGENRIKRMPKGQVGGRREKRVNRTPGKGEGGRRGGGGRRGLCGC